MKSTYWVIVFFFSFCTYGQQIKVQYDSYLIDGKDQYGGVNIISADLITNENEALYKCSLKDTIFEIPSLGEYSSQKSSIPFVLFKRLKSTEAYYIGQSVGRKPVRDTEYKVKWNLENSNKTILGYQCYKASCEWRGRSYAAFYTPDIPISSGPYKFDGLPGMILEITSHDGAVRIIARSLEKSTELIANPFLDKDTISWQEFLTLYNKKFEDFRNLSLHEDATQTIPKRYIETYIE